MQYIKTLIILLFFILPISLYSFGKNKIQYKNFEWFYIQSKHFDVYFYPGGKNLAEFAAEVAEKAYEQISRDYAYQIKNRIVFIVYKSHNDWQQTNVVLDFLTEGIGGVTELYKNRIVVPFEGSYEQFRHVVHHELVHGVMNDLLYGGSIQSLVMGEVLPVPLWVSEGLAEFNSTGWNTQTDMIVRDAVLTGYIPPVQYLQYIMAYQGGNSVFRFISENYGRKKIGEILHKARGKITFEQVIKSAVGLDYENLTKKWHRYLKKMYFPEEANRMVPEEFSRALTDHQKLNNFLNLSPAISPQGDKIAYITERKGYQNVYLMSAIDGKHLKVLIEGERSESFEELHFLRPGMSFSPDGKKLSLTAKSGEWDAIYIIDIASGKKEKYLMKMDGAFTTSWSPDGTRIAFVGNKDEKSDIYIFNVNSGEIKALTNDIFTDDQPSWSPDSKYITFVSDRSDFLSPSQIPEDLNLNEYEYEFRDIYIANVETGEIRRCTNTHWEEAFPIFSPDGKKLAFTSDENGIYNIYIQDLETGGYYPITNVISGVLQIQWSRDASKLVYSTFYQMGYDIYMINNPLDLKPQELELTQFAKDMREGKIPVYARNWEPSEEEKEEESKKGEKEFKGEAPSDYSRYVFGSYKTQQKKKTRSIELPEENLKDEFGDYRPRKYKIKFSPDFVTGAAGFNTYFGIQGYTAFAFSDLMGDHQIYLSTNLWADLRNSDFTLNYYYLKRRINYGLGGYHLVYIFQDSFYNLVRYRNFGAVFTASYPFNRFTRVDFNLVWYNVHLENLTINIPTEKVNTILPDINYIHDNVLWGFQWGILAPVSGSRYAFTLRLSPKYNENSRDFQTFKLDYRKYFMLSTKYQFAFRGNAGISIGKNSQQFFLGGIDNWINRKYRGGRRIDRIDDVFFSEFVTPLRGALYYDRIGDRFFLVNSEFRFPLIEYLQLGIPPVTLFNIRGVGFFDIGSAWYQDSGDWWSFKDFKATIRDPEGKVRFRDVIAGFGVGARIYFIGFLIRFDVAWPWDLQDTGKPVYYWSLGLDL